METFYREHSAVSIEDTDRHILYGERLLVRESLRLAEEGIGAFNLILKAGVLFIDITAGVPQPCPS